MLITRKLLEEGLSDLRDIADLDIWEEDAPIPREELLRRIADKDALISLLSDRIDRDVIDRAKGLKVIGNYAVGFDNVDVEHATSKGIPVLNTPSVLTEATADLTFALLMAAARRIAEGERLVRSGAFNSWGPTLLLGKDVWGATLGVVGAGKIGTAVLRRGKGFGMRLLYHSKPRNEEVEKELGAMYVPLEELLGSSDFVTLNVPLTAETRHLIGEKELAMMKRDAILINTSRGPVVDENALSKALTERRIQAAALDVYEEEPKVHPWLLSIQNVVLAPHIGSATVTARTNMAKLVASGVAAVLKGERPGNVVNPDVFKKGSDGR